MKPECSLPHYRVYKSSLLIPILNQMNSVPPLSCSVSLKSISILFSYSPLGFPRGVITLGFPTETLCTL